MNSVYGREMTVGTERESWRNTRCKTGETRRVTQGVKCGSSPEIKDRLLKCFKPQDGEIRFTLPKMSNKWRMFQQALYKSQ